jgi:DNA-binding beta-propeller fold protein YncE
MRQLLLPVRLATLLVCALAVGFATGRAQDKGTVGGPRKPQKIVKDGIEIEFTVEPPATLPKGTELLAGQDAVFRFKIHDTASKTPLSGAKPAAWAAQRERPEPPGPDQCRAKVESFLQGSLRSRPDVDLNAYHLLALNEEANISVIDPLLGFGGTKLLALVLLKSPGEDWVLTTDRMKLFVSMPVINQIAVVDTSTWKVMANLDAGISPARLALQPDEKYLWVANETGVAVIDTLALKVAKHIATGVGHHEVAFGEDNKFAFVTNREDGTLSIVDVAKLRKSKDVKTGGPASSLAFSPLSKALYVVNEVDGNIAVIDSTSHNLVANIAAKRGLKTVRFAPDGRWGFIPNPADSVVYIFDASTNRLVHEQAVGATPDQIAFSGNFAYVRSLGTEQVSAIRLSTLGKQLDVVKFPGGQNAPGSASAFTSSADAFVPAPEAGSMILANPADQMIYYYSEGMAAPMGNFQNYRRVPRAVMVVDRSLREETQGVYTTTARLPKAGVYNVSLLLSSPRVVHCFEAVAKSNPTLKDDQQIALSIEYLNKEASFRTGEDYKVRFRLTDTETKKPSSILNDVGVLVFLAPGIWQQRQIAKPLGEGLYEVTVNVPETGVYLLFVESPSQRVQYRQLPYMTLHAAPRLQVGTR